MTPLASPTVEDIAWQTDYDAFVKRAQHVAQFEEVQGAAPVFTGRTVTWIMTYRRIFLFKPRPDAPTPGAPQYQVELDEVLSSNQQTPYVDVRALVKGTERSSFEKLKPGAKITVQCRVNFSSRVKKTDTGALGVFVALEDCVLK